MRGLVAMALGVFASAGASAQSIAGDIDASGRLDAADVQSVVNAALGVGAHPRADVDCSGAVGAVDVQLVVNAVLGLTIDTDGEGLCDAAEAILGSDPRLPDTDGDGTDDWQEYLDGTLAAPMPDLGPNASLHGRRPFPADNPWNTPIDLAPVDPQSDIYISSIGRDAHFHPDFGADWNGGPFGIPYVVVAGDQPKVPIAFDYADESDPGPYPIPPGAPIEGGYDSDGDRHILVVDRDNWRLYETWSTYPAAYGWTAGSGAVFDLASNSQRPAGWTSADAAGLPIFPGLVRYDEAVELGEIRHALRFTVQQTRRAYVYPATHFASTRTDPALPPMGMRVRLKATVAIEGFPSTARVILRALQTYGMILADNGGNWYVSGAPDARWNDDDLNTLKNLTGDDFEVVQLPPLVTE